MTYEEVPKACCEFHQVYKNSSLPCGEIDYELTELLLQRKLKE